MVHLYDPMNWSKSGNWKLIDGADRPMVFER